ncbi:MAG: ABC transporter ATP-binding protein [Hyphomicrobiaceae bacterium]|nr:MAG: ABC transporter ATP-binding protein [Hyphomicrobiaceae bacterium]
MLDVTTNPESKAQRAQQDEPILTIEGLSVALPRGADRPFAVENLDLEIHRKETVCIVGESGSGKSVTAHTVMGLIGATQLKPVAGRIMFDGADLLQMPPDRLRALRCVGLSMIFQEPMTALNPIMTCGAQIDEVLRWHTDLNATARHVAIVRMLEEVNLPDPERIMAAIPQQLSGGQRQRVLIAMALILHPALLIADEPTTALDVTTQAQILRLLKNIQQNRGMGMLFITHDFGVVADIADHVIVMQHGRVVEAGRAEDVLLRPQHAYTQALIRAVPNPKPKSRVERQDAPVVLATSDLGKTYATRPLFGAPRKITAMHGVSLEVRRGETLGIIGESGSGKTTFARSVSRLIEPSSGAIMFEGTNIGSLNGEALRPYRRQIQIVFQDPYRSLNPRRKIGDSIVEGPVNYGIGRVEAIDRARQLMTFVSLNPEALDRYPHQFSGGQRQRICIARALAMEPTLLIADEAVSALDVSVQAQVLELLNRVRREFDLAMLFITHDLRVAAQVCDRVAVMSKGEVVECDSAQAIFQRPQHAYTRSLLDAIPARHWTFGEM